MGQDFMDILYSLSIAVHYHFIDPINKHYYIEPCKYTTENQNFRRQVHYLKASLLSKYNTYRKNYKTHTICPGSSNPFYIVTYYIKCVTTSWTYSS